MLKQAMFAAIAAALTIVPAAAAEEHADWCTDAHMKQMDTQVAAMTDAKKQKSAQAHLDKSKDAMKKGNTKESVVQMKMAHKDMGL